MPDVAQHDPPRPRYEVRPYQSGQVGGTFKGDPEGIGEKDGGDGAGHGQTTKGGAGPTDHVTPPAHSAIDENDDDGHDGAEGHDRRDIRR